MELKRMPFKNEATLLGEKWGCNTPYVIEGLGPQISLIQASIYL